MRRRAGPVQEWVDSIPSPSKPAAADVHSNDVQLEENPTPPQTPVSVKGILFTKPTMTISTPISVPNSPAIAMVGAPSPIRQNRLARDPSFQSDSSHCSSVESLLELRRADPEAILLGLGFGGCPNSSQENGPLSRIPKRFLQPSKLKGIAINDFVKHQQETSESYDSASLGYRGLTGSPYVAPSEIVQKIMERLREHESHEQDAYTVHNNNTEPYSPIFQDTSRLSVLSPDNRQFLERPRSKSPDMRNKRMIIGQKSFAFGCDGDLIEINPLNQKQAQLSSTNGNENEDRDDELSDQFVTRETILDMNLEPTYPDKTTIGMSRISNGRREKRLAKQSSIDNSNSLPNDFCSRSLGDGSNCGSDESESGDECHNESTSFEITRRLGVNSCNDNCRREYHEDCGNERILSNSPRRASDGSCDIKMPWARLSIEEGRRFSDGVLKQSQSLLSRRRSLKRQAKISDTETVEYCDRDSCKDLVLSEEIERFECSKERTENPASEKDETKETEDRSQESDRLSKPDSVNCSEITKEELLLIDTKKSSEINGKLDTNSIDNENGDDGDCCTKKVKKRHGISEIRNMLSSVLSVRMEPGF